MIPCRDSSSASATTPSNNDAALAAAQRHFPLLGGLNGPSLLHPDALDGIGSKREALCISLQIGHRRSQGWYADRLNIGRARFSRMLNGSAAVAVDAVALANLTGNWTLLQWEARAGGFDLTLHRESEVETLRRENAELRAKTG